LRAAFSPLIRRRYLHVVAVNPVLLAKAGACGTHAPWRFSQT